MTRARLARVAAGAVVALVVGAFGWQAGAPVESLTPFTTAKAEWFLENRLPCLGCHTLGGRGGRIGPILDGVGGRLSHAEIASVVADPRRARPGTIMPRTAMPDSTRALVVNYLAGLTDAETSPAVPILGPAASPGSSDAAALYRRHCAACHGADGAGDGPNARFLPTVPTVHSNAAYMSTRPDDVLYDGIAAGGYVLDRSPFMPDYGGTLTPTEIRALVGYLRVLCACEGPPWSRDDR